MDLIWQGKRILVPGGGLHIGWVEPPPSYPSVVIGTQTWMLNNITDNIASSRVYADNESNRPDYGGLYDFSMIPTIEALYPGWHVPSFTEWATLSTYLGGDLVSGKHLKEVGTTHWNTYDSITNDNSSNFTARGGGFYIHLDNYYQQKVNGYYWSSTSYDAGNAWVMHLGIYGDDCTRTSYDKLDFYSIRLIKT